MNDLIYKVGEANCNKVFDKNGGFYEYNLIKSEITKLLDNGFEKLYGKMLCFGRRKSFG